MPNNKESLYQINLNEMGELMHQKKESRLNKDAEFNCFIISTNAIDTFFSKLRSNINHLPDKTRFQLGVYDPGYGHWFLIDCYIKDQILHTLTLDAALLRGTVIPTGEVLNKYFPQGKGEHYVLTGSNNIKLQHSIDDCQTFTREHAAVVSRIDAQKLFEVLSVNAQQTHFRSLKALDMAKPKKEIAILAPIFRSMQSIKKLTEIATSPGFIDTAVSRQRNMNLTDWVKQNSGIAYKKNGDPTVRNFSIKNKEKTYVKNLIQSQIIKCLTALDLVISPFLC